MKVSRNPLLNIFQYVVILVVTISGQGATHTHTTYTPQIFCNILLLVNYISKKRELSGVLLRHPLSKGKDLDLTTCFVGPIHSTHIDNKRIVCRVFKLFPEPIISAIWEAERLIGRGRPCPHNLGVNLPPRTR